MTKTFKAPPIIMTDSTITVILKNKTHSIHRDNINFVELKRVIRDKKWDKLEELLNPVIKIKNFVKGDIKFKDGQFFFKDTVVHNVLTAKMFAMAEQGFPIEPMVAFMTNLLENPSKRAVDELFGFLQTNNLPITEDGHFLAYKKVREDYLDVHSGTLSNKVGNVVEMPRNMVDDDKNHTCSAGLHFCSIDYLKSFGGDRVVILKINPRDVVSIPTDYNNSKGRACRYKVIGEQGIEEVATSKLRKKAVVKAKAKIKPSKAKNKKTKAK